MVRKIKPDFYLQKFISFCKINYRDNLAAIVVFGSYVCGGFDKTKSDYDLFILFKNKTPRGRSFLRKKFPKCSLIYFNSLDEMKERIRFGHFTSYITLLTEGSRVLYSTREYNIFLNEISKMNLLEETIDVAGVEWKANYEKNVLKKNVGHKAIKWALPMVRRRLQLLTFIRKRKLIWNLEKITQINKSFLTKKEIDFILDLNVRDQNRLNKFSREDKKIIINLVDKLDKEIIEKIF
jgi:hypothetical protein